jgi:hypothetical protein
MTIELTDEIGEHINGALLAGNPAIIASVDEAGKPKMSFRGSLQVYSGDQLGFWARNAEGTTTGGIGANANVAVLYRAPASRVMLQFAGRARVTSDPAERAKVFESAPEFEQKADPERKGAAVIIDLDRVEGILGLDDDGKRRLVRMTRG